MITFGAFKTSVEAFSSKATREICHDSLEIVVNGQQVYADIEFEQMGVSYLMCWLHGQECDNNCPGTKRSRMNIKFQNFHVISETDYQLLLALKRLKELL